MSLALLGGSPLRSRSFAAQNTIGAEEKRAVNEVLDSGVLSSFLGEYHPDFYGGPRVKALEAAYAERFATKHAVSTNSATTALHVAVAAAGVGPGDEVIVSPYTMAASATAILMQNAIPVFADVEDETFGLDPKSIAERITPRTKAIMVVHIFGHPARMDEIMALARKHQLKVIEDAAQAIGAVCDGKFAGNIGDAGILSLNYHKIIHTGEGGVLLCNDDTLAERARMVRNHGECVVEAMSWQDLANTFGSNYRMTEIEAAIGVEQLRKLDGLLARRHELAAHLTKRLGALGKLITPPAVRAGCTHSYYVYAVRFHEEAAGISRKTLARALTAEGIPFGEGYVKPLYLLPLFQKRIAYGDRGCPWTCGLWSGQVNYDKGICPTVERLHEREVLLADICHHPLTVEDMDDVADGFEKVFDNLDALRAWEHGANETEDIDSRPGRWRR